MGHGCGLQAGSAGMHLFSRLSLRYEYLLVILPCREICKIKGEFLKYIFIYLAVPSLSCGMWDLVS